ncbi:DUF4179 domain-containing protein [Bacillus sp. JJ1521]|uniref:DUF4179 domain-containing protein n=1 Tax=Bacillus sp. JJ1521 TaxID=3122957 RepID=UPI002FFEB5B1
MSNVEERLSDEKKRLNSITAPEELEDRLRDALNKTPIRKKRVMPNWLIAAVALLFISLISYNYNAFAFYGKKLLGFDEVITGTLKDLNDEGMGQVIGKKAMLTDGTDLIIDGIMTDENQLILYYTLSNPAGISEESTDPLTFAKITGFLTDSNRGGGTYIFSDNQTEIKGMLTFDPVSSFAKKLTLHYQQTHKNNQMIEGTMTFPYDPNQAMQTEIKQSIKKTLKVDKGKINFKTITATPTSTVVRGTLNVENFSRLPLGLDGIELVANGTSVPVLGSGVSTTLNGTKFDIQYDTLPKQLKTLQLIMKDFVGYQQLEEKISLEDVSDKPIHLAHNKHIWIKDVSITEKGVEITITTENSVLLDEVSIEVQNEIISLKTTINHKEPKDEMKERTLLFETNNKPEFLIIKGMHYVKEYNQTIDLKVN